MHVHSIGPLQQTDLSLSLCLLLFPLHSVSQPASPSISSSQQLEPPHECTDQHIVGSSFSMPTSASIDACAEAETISHPTSATYPATPAAPTSPSSAGGDANSTATSTANGAASSSPPQTGALDQPGGDNNDDSSWQEQKPPVPPPVPPHGLESASSATPTLDAASCKAHLEQLAVRINGIEGLQHRVIFKPFEDMFNTNFMQALARRCRPAVVERLNPSLSSAPYQDMDSMLRFCALPDPFVGISGADREHTAGPCPRPRFVPDFEYKLVLNPSCKGAIDPTPHTGTYKWKPSRGKSDNALQQSDQLLVTQNDLDAIAVAFDEAVRATNTAVSLSVRAQVALGRNKQRIHADGPRSSAASSSSLCLYAAVHHEKLDCRLSIVPVLETSVGCHLLVQPSQSVFLAADGTPLQQLNWPPSKELEAAGSVGDQPGRVGPAVGDCNSLTMQMAANRPGVDLQLHLLARLVHLAFSCAEESGLPLLPSWTIDAAVVDAIRSMPADMFIYEPEAGSIPSMMARILCRVRDALLQCQDVDGAADDNDVDDRVRPKRPLYLLDDPNFDGFIGPAAGLAHISKLVDIGSGKAHVVQTHIDALLEVCEAAAAHGDAENVTALNVLLAHLLECERKLLDWLAASRSHGHAQLRDPVLVEVSPEGTTMQYGNVELEFPPLAVCEARQIRICEVEPHYFIFGQESLNRRPTPAPSPWNIEQVDASGQSTKRYLDKIISLKERVQLFPFTTSFKLSSEDGEHATFERPVQLRVEMGNAGLAKHCRLYWIVEKDKLPTVLEVKVDGTTATTEVKSFCRLAGFSLSEFNQPRFERGMAMSDLVTRDGITTRGSAFTAIDASTPFTDQPASPSAAAAAHVAQPDAPLSESGAAAPTAGWPAAHAGAELPHADCESRMPMMSVCRDGLLLWVS